MTSDYCEHRTFAATVDVGRISVNEDDGPEAEISHFVCDVRVECAECGRAFGFRCPDVGVLPDRPAVSINALELRVPMISPAELELLGPLAAMREPKGSGFTVRFRAGDSGEPGE